MNPDFESLYRSHIKNIKGSGVQLSGLCPFHDDHNNSFSYNTDSGLWICHVDCGAGNAYQFALRVGIDPSPYKNGYNGGTMGFSIGDPLTRNSEVQTVNKSMELDSEVNLKINIYHEYLIANFEALAGDLPWTIETVKETLVGYDSEKKRFTFPHFDQEGKAINLKWHKGVNGKNPHSIIGHGSNRLYPLRLLNNHEKLPLIYCEGEKDVLTLISNGYNAVSQTTGAGSIPKDLTPLEPFKLIIILLDNDNAGRKGSKQLAETLKRKFPQMHVEIASWPDEYDEKFDITDFFQSNSEEDFHEILLNSIEYHLIEEENSEVSGKVVEDKKLTDFHLTDAGNAELLKANYGEWIRYNHTEKCWLIWNNQYWKKDTTEQIKQYAIDMAKHRQSLSQEIDNANERAASFKFGIKSENVCL